MYIHQVARGTEFIFMFDDGSEHRGVFDGNIDHVQFYLISSGISRNLDYYKDQEPKVRFLNNNNYYDFTARLMGVSDKKDAFQESLAFKTISPLKEVQRRGDFRIDIALKVNVHSYLDDVTQLYSGGWLFNAVSSDVSKNGIRLFSDYSPDEPEGTMFTLEFSLVPGVNYMVPATIVRNQQNTATRSYNYDLGFIFDFAKMPEKQEKLLLDILDFKMKNKL